MKISYTYFVRLWLVFYPKGNFMITTRTLGVEMITKRCQVYVDRLIAWVSITSTNFPRKEEK